MAERCQSTSAPAQKLSPSPASRTARASPTSAKASVSSRISAASKALRRSGRASVTRSSGPSRSIRSAAISRQLKVGLVLRGALAAVVTPLAGGGEVLDEDAFDPLVGFLESAGLDGLLALGTTGEGILLSAAERRGADAVAVIGPPYFALDDEALLAHFEAAAQACEPVPFYVYEFAARSGYAVPVAVLDRLRDSAPNFTGLKVSDRPWERFEPYLVEGLDVFVGPESLIQRGLAGGAVGVVSGLATAFPSEVAAAVRGVPGPDLEALRDGLEQFPFHAAAKHVLRRRGVPITEDVRAPLRELTEDEREALDRWLGSL